MAFDALRRVGLKGAQDASRAIWSDYNIHDPGVTLLEHTCFALTELGYLNSHDIADLLSIDADDLALETLGLFGPRAVLPASPVTEADLEARLMKAPQIARATLRHDPAPGLYAASLVAGRRPDGSHWPAQAVADAAQARFADCHPLGTRLVEVQVARPRDCHLAGRITLAALARPEYALAELVFHVTQILSGLPRAHGDQAKGATRAEVLANPLLIHGEMPKVTSGLPPLGPHLNHLTSLPGIAGLKDLSLLKGAWQPRPGADDPDPDTQPHWMLADLTQTPDKASDLPALLIEQDGHSITLDPAAFAKALRQVTTDHLARAPHALDPDDWDQPIPHQPRTLPKPAPDALLPPVYRQAADSLAPYRAPVTSHLAGIRDTLKALPRTLTTKVQPAATPEARKAQITALDHLLALQGEAMPDIAGTGLNLYRSAHEAAAFAVTWRRDLLKALPDLNTDAGTGPTDTRPGGLLKRLAHLADLTAQPALRFSPNTPAGGVPRQPLFPPIGLALDPSATPHEGTLKPGSLSATDSPLDLLPPLDDSLEPLTPDALLAHAPFARDGCIHPDHLSRTCQHTAWLCAPVSSGRTLVLFDDATSPDLWPVASFEDPADAMAMANRLRRGWQALFKAAETITLIEEVALTDTPNFSHAHRAHLILPGWTPRTSQPAFRRHLHSLIRTHAPAQCLIMTHWLDLDTCERLEATLAEAKTSDIRGDIESLLTGLEGSDP